jgi:RNA polymerase sigma-70 factor, ECF subfamily
MAPTDAQLVELYFAGDEQAYEMLIQRHLSSVYGFVFHFTGGAQDIEDITQDIFLKAWKNLKRFDRTKNFKTWIFEIAKNTAIDFVRKKSLIPLSAIEDEEGDSILESLPDPLPLPDELFVRNDLGEILSCILEKLSFSYYIEQLSFQEIATLLDKPVSTVKSQHRRALSLLRRELLDYREDLL